jgi:hypothetical protein
MDSNSILISFSQIALGLAGFSSVLVALSGSQNQWTPIDLFRIKNMLFVSLLTTFVSLFKILLTFFAIEKNNKWYISLTTLATLSTIAIIFSYLSYLKLSLLDREEIGKKLYLSLVFIMVIFSCMELVVASIYIDQAPGMFFLGIILNLLVCVVWLLRFMFSRHVA